MSALTVRVRGRDYWRSLREVEARQARCEHVWVHRDETVHNRLVSSTWCRKCKISGFAFERDRAAQAH